MITWKLNKISIQQLNSTDVANVSFSALPFNETLNDTIYYAYLFLNIYTKKQTLTEKYRFLMLFVYLAVEVVKKNR